MKRLIATIGFISLISLSATARSQEEINPETFEYRTVEHNAFQVGELLKYKFAYGFMNAGEATLEIKKSPKKIQNREVLMVEGRGYSISAFDWFFKVRDQYDTYLDAEGIFPWLFVRSIEEGGYSKKQNYKFYQNEGRLEDVYKKQEYAIPHGIQDMVSSFYYARTIDFTNAKKGQLYSFDAFVDGEIIPIRIRYAGTKTIKVDAGKFDCMVFHPAVQEGRIFEDDDALTVYISNDENKIPVLAKAKVLVGSIRMELINYQNLVNPVARK
jgi:hypothetical protein